MTRKFWPALGPGLLVGAGILVSTYIAVLAAESGWWVLTGPLLLALVVAGADMMASRLQGSPAGPSWLAMVVGGSFLLASAIVALRDPSLVKLLLPILGATAVTPLLLRLENRRKACRLL